MSVYSQTEAGLSVIANVRILLVDDPAMPGGTNEAVALMVRAGAMRYDESGESGVEQFFEVQMNRRHLAEIKRIADDLWLDTCAFCGMSPRTGLPLTVISPWRIWAAARRARVWFEGRRWYGMKAVLIPTDQGDYTVATLRKSLAENPMLNKSNTQEGQI